MYNDNKMLFSGIFLLALYFHCPKFRSHGSMHRVMSIPKNRYLFPCRDDTTTTLLVIAGHRNKKTRHFDTRVKRTVLSFRGYVDRKTYS